MITLKSDTRWEIFDINGTKAPIPLVSQVRYHCPNLRFWDIVRGLWKSVLPQVPVDGHRIFISFVKIIPFSIHYLISTLYYVLWILFSFYLISHRFIHFLFPLIFIVIISNIYEYRYVDVLYEWIWKKPFSNSFKWFSVICLDR